MRNACKTVLVGWLTLLLAGQTLFPLSESQAGRAHCMATHAHHAMLQVPFDNDVDGEDPHHGGRICCHFNKIVPAAVYEPAPSAQCILLHWRMPPPEVPEPGPQIVLGFQVPPD